MTTPQQPAKRLKQKRRRTKQLAAWRAKKEAPGGAKAAPAKKIAKAAKPEKAAKAKG